MLVAVDYEIKKRLPPRFQRSKTDVYISRNTSISAQKARIEKLLIRSDCVKVYGLGAAVKRAINVALQIQRKLIDSVSLDVRCGTVKVTDDLFPLCDEHDYQTNGRNVSAVLIKISCV